MADIITIKLFSTLGRFAWSGKTEFTIDWHPRMQVRDILDLLKIPDTAERVILVNSRNSRPDKELFAGDIIVLSPPPNNLRASSPCNRGIPPITAEKIRQNLLRKSIL